LFSQSIPEVGLAGRLGFFSQNWEKVTSDQHILSIIEGYEIPFTKTPYQGKLPFPKKLNQEEEALVEEELTSMLQKGAIRETQHVKSQFLSNLFLVKKKGGGNRPVINLKSLNTFIPYQHFKMEGLHMLKDLLKEGDFMCKLDLKDAYFIIPIKQNCRKYLRFLWKERVFEFLCLCFGLGPAPLIFTKIMKVPLAILRQMNIILIIYLDDILIISRTRAGLIQSRDTVIFLLQNLGFVINIKKSAFEPTQKIEFLGMMVDSRNLNISLPKEKVNQITSQCQTMIKSREVPLMDLTKLLGRMNATYQALLPGRIQQRYLQYQQIQACRLQSYQDKIILNKESVQELHWWVHNLRISNGRSLVLPQADMQMSTDASLKGWGPRAKG